MEGETSTAVIVVTLVLAAVALLAFRMSVRRSGAHRRLVRWVRDHRAAQWDAVARSRGWIHPTAVVENLRRGGLDGDPEFMSLYGDIKRYARREIILILVGCGLIGVLLIGVRYGGWHW